MNLSTLLIALGAIVVILLLCVSISAGVAFFAMLLWNGVVSPLFSVTTLTFLQAWGILFLLGLVGGAFKTSVTIRK